MMKNFEVIQIHPHLARPLRHKVLWPHIAFEEECNIDIDLREDAIHLATVDGERIVSVGSLFQMDSPKIDFSKQYRLRAMATDPAYRGQHAGKVLVEKAFDILREKGVDVLWCDAREVAVGFYESLGFVKLPEKYDIPKIGPHYFMYKIISGQ
ncbi:MAG: GNAT family N-acetyltransferase [Flavobacteriales bacterium]